MKSIIKIIFTSINELLENEKNYNKRELLRQLQRILYQYEL